MAIADRPRLQRFAKLAEDVTGVAVRPTSQVRRSALIEQEFEAFANESEELALQAMDYLGGRPSELRPERRKRLAQRSRIALMEDPLAGAEAQLLGDFAFGKGISVPTARDEKVQDVIDAAWSAASNNEKLTGYNAQRKLSNELLTSGELFVTLYVSGGKITVGRLDPDLVNNIVPDPEDRLRPLYYVVRVRKYEWDYAMDRPQFEVEQLAKEGRPRVKYWKHWRNVEDAEREREEGDMGEDEVPLEAPPKDKLARGVVYHVAINQTGEQLRGNPPWARSLRYLSAMNVLTEAHVTMAQAASSFIARRAMRGTPRQIAKAASSILSSVGELGATAWQRGPAGAERPEPTTQSFAAFGSPPPVPPGSWWNDNDSSKLEALNLNSGAGQMQQTAQIVRAPIAASSGFGQHYLGDANSMNLANAATLELPSTMHVGSWQENFEGLYRWFTDRAIEAAVKEGLLGGAGVLGDRPMEELRLHESEDRSQMEKRTGRDLSYEFTMPFPGRRQLTDVATVVASVAASYDPMGMNVPLRKILLRLLFEQMSIDDVSRAVEDCVPDAGLPGAGPGFAPAPPGAPGAPGAPAAAGSTAAAAGVAASEPAGDTQQPYGAKSQGTQMKEEAWLPADMRSTADALASDTDSLFEELMRTPALHAALASANGSSGGTD